MKKMLTRMWQSGTALLMVLCLVVGLCPTVAFAQETAPENTIKYVSLGDSMANGYGLPGYDFPKSVNGFMDEVTDSYPAQVADYYGWDLTPMATSAMRAEDLHYILEYPNGFQGDEYTRTEFIERRWNDYAGINDEWAGVANVAKAFQNNIADADVVSMGIGNANFGVFMLRRITNALGILGGNSAEDAWIEFQNALVECDEETKAFALQAYDVLKEKVNEHVPAGAKELVDPLVNIFAYAVTSYALNYGGVIEAIVELNSDVEIMVVGLMNTFSGVKLTYKGEIIDLGALMDEVIGVANAYLAALPAALQAGNKYPEAIFYYTAASNVSMIVDNLGDEIMNPETVVRDRTITEVINVVWPMLNDMTEAAGEGSMYINISSQNVEQFEAAMVDSVAFAQYLGGMVQSGMSVRAVRQMVQSIVTYLAFEKATIEASELEVLDANAFISLATGLDGGVFDGVYGSFDEKLYQREPNAETMDFATAVSNNIGGSIDAFTIYAMLSTPDAMSEALVEDEMVASLLNLFGRMLVGNGIGCHPSAAGHDTLTQAFVASYGKHTVQDETVKNIKIVLNELYNLLETYGPEVAAQVWAQWEEYGYVDAVETTMSELKTMLSQRYTYYTETALPAIANSVDALSAQKDALTTELAKLKIEQEAKQDELANVINNVEIGSIHTPDINIDVQLGGNEQTEVTGNDCVVDGESIEAELEAAVKDLEHAIAVIEALIADVEADIADMVALAEQIAAAVEELEKTMADVAAAAGDLEKAVNEVINVIKNSDGVVNQVIHSFEAARATAQAAVEVLDLTIGTAEEMMADVDVMIEKISTDAEALYNKFMTELPGCIEQIPEEALMLVGGTIMAAQQAYEANKEEINANLQAELAKLAAEYGISEENIRTKLAELAAEYNISEENIRAELAEIEAKITEEVNAKYAEIEAEIGVQIENKKAEAAKKLAALEEEVKGYQAELEGLAADAAEEARKQLQAQIDRVNNDIAVVNQDLACAIEHLENAAQEAYEQIVAEVTKVYEEAIATLEKQLEELKAAYDKAVAELEKQLEELKKAYDKAVEELTDAADKQIDKLTEELNKQLEELDKIGQALADEINGILTAIREELAGVQKAVEEILNGNLAAVEDLKNALVAMGGEAIVDAVESLNDAVMALIEEATTADLTIDDDFKYVAIGDGSAATESYVEKLTAALNAEAAENGVNEIELVNYAKIGNTISAERANLSDVTGADLITIGFSNVEFIASAVKAAPGKVEMNWAEVVGAENVHYVDELLAEVAAKIAEAGITGELAEMVNNAIEAYAYAAMVYATELPELVNDIHAANPDALVIIVGMYNPLEDVIIALDENTTLDIGEYIDYLVDGVAVHGIAYSILSGNSIYVDAPAVQTNNTDMELGIMDLTYLILDDFADLYPSALGDDYIAAEIADALNITYVKTEESGLLGDADSDGIVNIRDAMLVGQYANKQIGADKLNLDVCDVDGDSAVIIRDAMQIGQYANKQIAQFTIQ